MSSSPSWDKPPERPGGVLRILSTAAYAAVSIGGFVAVVTYFYTVGVRDVNQIPALNPNKSIFLVKPEAPGGAVVAGGGSPATNLYGDDNPAPAPSAEIAPAPQRPTAEDVAVAEAQAAEPGAALAAREALAFAEPSDTAALVDLDAHEAKSKQISPGVAALPEMPPNVGQGSVGGWSAQAVGQNSGQNSRLGAAPTGEPVAMAVPIAAAPADAPVAAPPATAQTPQAVAEATRSALTELGLSSGAPVPAQTDGSAQTAAAGSQSSPQVAALDLGQQAGAADGSALTAAGAPSASSGDAALSALAPATTLAPRRRPARTARLATPLPAYGGGVEVPLDPALAAQQPAAPQPQAQRPAAPAPQQQRAGLPTPVLINPVGAAVPLNSPAQPAQAVGDYVVQLTALQSERAIRDVWRQYLQKHPDLLGGKQMYVEQTSRKSPTTGRTQSFFRLRVVAGGKRDADQLCADLKRAGLACYSDKR